MTTLKITVEDAALSGALRQLQGQLGDLDSVLADIGATLESRVHQRFDFKRDPSGAAWKPVSPGLMAGSGLKQHT